MVCDGLQDRLITLTVNGRSMSPLLKYGDRIDIEPTEPEELEPGDIVTLMVAGTFLTHRFRQMTTDPSASCLLQTRGDHQRQDDPPIPCDQLVGRVVRRHRSRLQFNQGIGLRLNRALYRLYKNLYHFEALYKKEPGQLHIPMPVRIAHHIVYYCAACIIGVVSIIALWLQE